MGESVAYILAIPKNTQKDYNMIESMHDSSIPFEILYLTDNPKLKKVLVKDTTIDKSVLDSYKFVIPVGAEPFTKILKLTGGVTRYAGTYVEDPYRAVPIVSPNIVYINPARKPEIEKQFAFISAQFYGKVPNKKVTKSYTLIETMPEYEKLCNDLKSPIVCDLETTAFIPSEGDIICAAVTDSEHKGYTIPFSIIDANREPFQELMEHNKIIFHNAKFDMQWLYKKLAITIPDFEDTLLVHYAFINQNKGTHSLKDLCMKYTDLGAYDNELDDWKKKFCRKNKVKVADFTYDLIPMDILAPYAAMDADATMQLWNNMAIPTIKKACPTTVSCYETILKPATVSLFHLELAGAPLNIGRINELDNLYANTIQTLRAAITNVPAAAKLEADQGTPFNPNSFQQIGKLLYKYIGLPVLGKTATGNPKTDAETLKALSDKSIIPDLILKLRKTMKLRNTYVLNIKDMYAGDERIHGSFNLCSTTSGRLSSSSGGDA